MKTRERAISGRERYLDLVRAFPLRPIRSEPELHQASEVLIRLLASTPEDEMDAGERDYLDALTLLIAHYERGRKSAKLLKLSPLELLKHLMDERKMTVGELGRVIGNQPSASLILHGKRAMSKAQIMKLAKYFAVSPALFMQ